MKTTQFQDELTGSEYADVQSFDDLTVRFRVDRRILVPQVYDGPLQRVQGRGLPYNSLGVVAVPVAALPEGLRGLVQEDGLMGELEKAVKARYSERAPSELVGDDEEELLESVRLELGTFCVAGPGEEGVEVATAPRGPYEEGWEVLDALRSEMRNRNKPQDLLFLDREVEVILSGVRSASVPSAGCLKQKPFRSGSSPEERLLQAVKRDRLTRGRARIEESAAAAYHTVRSRCMPPTLIDVDYAAAEERVLAWSLPGQDVRRQKFALTATRITLL